ncbi:MAG: type I-E CRISPR-associated protein Cas5/CasD [Hyphomicrobiaceae bacterium]
MSAYLLFTLGAPIASFGTVAVGERRPTWDRPSKSQVIGLVAGCLGIERRESERQQALVASLGFAVRIDDAGTLATDYHTTQTPKVPRIKEWVKANGPIRTRADELAVDDLKTILSQREFRMGSCYTVCLWLKAAGPASLQDMRDKLCEPVFAPFAGRKANALMLPMRPLVVEAADLGGAFAAFDAEATPEMTMLWSELKFAPKGHDLIFADAEGIAPTQPIARLEERRDIPESRDKWRFGLRSEVLLRKPATTGETA